MKTRTITYGELRNGMTVVLYGYPLRVDDVHREDDERVVRFTGWATPDDESFSIVNTAYDGGTYGAFEHVEVAIVVDDEHRPRPVEFCTYCRRVIERVGDQCRGFARPLSDETIAKMNGTGSHGTCDPCAERQRDQLRKTIAGKNTRETR